MIDQNDPNQRAMKIKIILFSVLHSSNFSHMPFLVERSSTTYKDRTQANDAFAVEVQAIGFTFEHPSQFATTKNVCILLHKSWQRANNSRAQTKKTHLSHNRNPFIDSAEHCAHVKVNLQVFGKNSQSKSTIVNVDGLTLLRAAARLLRKLQFYLGTPYQDRSDF